MKRILITIFAALLFGTVTPLQAQETTLTPVSTPVAVETVVAPIPAVPETPVVTPSVDELSFWQIAIHLINAAVAGAIIYVLYRSVPVDVRKDLDTRVNSELDKAEDKAKTTDTPLDDLVVQAARYGYTLIKAGTPATNAGTGISFGATGNTTHTSGVLFVDKGDDDPQPTPEKP